MGKIQEGQTSESGWLSTLLLKPIPGLKGGLLISSIYVAGYLVWSFNAWKNNLGFLSLLDLRYFVAGTVPIAIIIMAYLASRPIKRFLLDVWPSLVSEDANGLWLIIRSVLLLLFYGCLVLAAFGPVLLSVSLLLYLIYKLLKRFAPDVWSRLADKESMGWWRPIRAGLILALLALFMVLVFRRQDLEKALLSDYAETITSISTIGLGISLTFLPPIKDRLFSWLSRVYRYLWLYGGGFLLIAAGMTLYIESVYPNLPQEFGGPRPRCAYLDVTPEQLSDETREAILPAGANVSNSVVMRSIQVYVFFSGQDFLLVRKTVSDPAGNSGPLYEINRRSVQAITWCD